MRRKAVFSAGILFALALLWLAFTHNETAVADNSSHGACGRIVSLAPSITETLFALDLGNDVVGVTRYCKFPPETEKITKVGGYIDPNFEAILSLLPDTVIALVGQGDASLFLNDKVNNVITVNGGSVKSILESIQTIGAKCGRENEAKGLINALSSRMEEIRKSALEHTGKKKKIMITVGRSIGTGSISDLFISGEDGFYSQMIEMAGGENAYKGATIKFPALSREGILRLDPDIVIEMIPNPAQFDLDVNEVKKEWEKHLSSVTAVKRGSVYIFTEDYSVIPGPRFILMLEKLAQVIESNQSDVEIAGK